MLAGFEPVTVTLPLLKIAHDLGVWASCLLRPRGQPPLSLRLLNRVADLLHSLSCYMIDV
jgi:hypothetical protein